MLSIDIVKKLEVNYFVSQLSDNGKNIIKVQPIVNNIVNQEVSIELINYDNNELNELYFVQRGKKFKRYSIDEYEESTLFLYFYVNKKIFSINYDLEIQNEILASNSLENIKKIFREFFKEKKEYSFLENKADAINLEKNNENKYNVFILLNDGRKQYFVENRELQNACLVLYNYTIKFSYFDMLISEFDNKIDTNTINKLKEVYFSSY